MTDLNLEGTLGATSLNLGGSQSETPSGVGVANILSESQGVVFVIPKGIAENNAVLIDANGLSVLPTIASGQSDGIKDVSGVGISGERKGAAERDSILTDANAVAVVGERVGAGLADGILLDIFAQGHVGERTSVGVADGVLKDTQGSGHSGEVSGTGNSDSSLIAAATGHVGVRRGVGDASILGDVGAIGTSGDASGSAQTTILNSALAQGTVGERKGAGSTVLLGYAQGSVLSGERKGTGVASILSTAKGEVIVTNKGRGLSQNIPNSAQGLGLYVYAGIGRSDNVLNKAQGQGYASEQIIGTGIADGILNSAQGLGLYVRAGIGRSDSVLNKAQGQGYASDQIIGAGIADGIPNASQGQGGMITTSFGHAVLTKSEGIAELINISAGGAGHVLRDAQGSVIVRNSKGTAPVLRGKGTASSINKYAEFFLNSESIIVQLELLEISHPNFTQVYRVVRNASEGITVTLETGETDVFFSYYPLSITNMGTNETLDYGLTIDFGDLGEILPIELDAVESAGGMRIKPQVLYRIYRSDDLTAPIFGPITLEITSISFTREGASFEAHAPIISLQRTGELYRIARFPMLKGFL